MSVLMLKHHVPVEMVSSSLLTMIFHTVVLTLHLLANNAVLMSLELDIVILVEN